MNFLAHFQLSNNLSDLIIGNFIADHVKGKAYLNFEPGIQQGILLHRQIDDFTDKHAIVEESKALIRKHQGKWAGVVIDIFYDHFLAKNWKQFENDHLPDYANHIYNLLENHLNKLPLKSQLTLYYMKKQDWLSRYAHTGGIERSLKGMSNRTSYDSNMHNAVEILNEHYKELEEHFLAYYPHLIRFVEERLTSSS